MRNDWTFVFIIKKNNKITLTYQFPTMEIYWIRRLAPKKWLPRIRAEHCSRYNSPPVYGNWKLPRYQASLRCLLQWVQNSVSLLKKKIIQFIVGLLESVHKVCVVIYIKYNIFLYKLKILLTLTKVFGNAEVQQLNVEPLSHHILHKTFI